MLQRVEMSGRTFHTSTVEDHMNYFSERGVPKCVGPSCWDDWDEQSKQ